jgi:hypothetical protein
MQEVGFGVEESLETVLERIQSRVPGMPSLKEVGISPRSFGLEMKVTMPRKDVEVTIGATVGNQWYQGKVTMDWLEDSVKLVYDCVQQYGATQAQAERYTRTGKS